MTPARSAPPSVAGADRRRPLERGAGLWKSVASWKPWATSSASASLPGAATHCIDRGIPSAAEIPVGIAIAGAPVRFHGFVLLPEERRDSGVLAARASAPRCCRPGG